MAPFAGVKGHHLLHLRRMKLHNNIQCLNIQLKPVKKPTHAAFFVFLYLWLSTKYKPRSSFYRSLSCTKYSVKPATITYRLNMCSRVCLRMCRCVCVCAHPAGVRKSSPGLLYCKFLVGRQTQPILIALGSLQWLFQRLSPDTTPLNLSSVKINCTSPPAFTWCSLRAPRGRLNHAHGFESTLLRVLRPLAWYRISKHNNAFSVCSLMHLFLDQTLN